MGRLLGVALAVWPASASAQLVLVGSLDGPAETVVVSGNHAYVGAGAELRIIDVSDPTSPTQVGAFTVPDRIYGFAAAEGRVYLACGLRGLLILDTSAPSRPRLLGTHETPGQAVSVAPGDDVALVVNLMTGLEVVDLSDPSAPTLVATRDTPGYQRDVTLAGTLAAVIDQPSGVYLFRVNGPRAPTALGHHPATDVPARSASVATDDRLYVVYDRTGLVEILDIADPDAPRLLGSYRPRGRPQQIAVSGATIYIPNGQAGVEVVNVSNPRAPSLRGTYDTPGAARGIAVAGSRVFVADSTALLVLEHAR